jgi:hypothetical protein
MYSQLGLPLSAAARTFHARHNSAPFKRCIAKTFFGNLAELKWSGTTGTNPNYIHKEIKNRLNSEKLATIHSGIFYLPVFYIRINVEYTRL